MESNEENKLTNKIERFLAVRGEGGWELGEKGEGSKRKKKPSQPDNTMFITRGRGGWGEAGEGKVGISGDRKRGDSGW